MLGSKQKTGGQNGGQYFEGQPVLKPRGRMAASHRGFQNLGFTSRVVLRNGASPKDLVYKHNLSL